MRKRGLYPINRKNEGRDEKEAKAKPMYNDRMEGRGSPNTVGFAP